MSRTHPRRSPREPVNSFLQQERRQRRLQPYEDVIERYRQRYSLKKISAMVHLDRRTVRRWIRAGAFPERQAPPRRPRWPLVF